MGCTDSRDKDIAYKDFKSIDLSNPESIKKTLLFNTVSKNYNVEISNSVEATMESILKNWESFREHVNMKSNFTEEFDDSEDEDQKIKCEQNEQLVRINSFDKINEESFEDEDDLSIKSSCSSYPKNTLAEEPFSKLDHVSESNISKSRNVTSISESISSENL